ncbi:unnamed protein product [Ixodes hexagonus]
MLKLLLNHWQESYNKSPARVTSEDPLLCTDLAKTRPNEEFLVSRVNPLFVDSSTEASPSGTIKKTSSETTADVHNPQDSDEPDSLTLAKKPPEPPDPPPTPPTPSTATPDSGSIASTSTKGVHEPKVEATKSETQPEPKELQPAHRADPQPEPVGKTEGQSDQQQTGTWNSDRSSSPRPLVELREWQENGKKQEDHVLNRLRNSGRASIITKEKLSLVEKVIAERLGKRIPEPGIRRTIELLKKDAVPTSQESQPAKPQEDVKSDDITEVKTVFRSDIKEDIRTVVKTDLIRDFRTDVETEVKTDARTDVKTEIKASLPPVAPPLPPAPVVAPVSVLDGSAQTEDIRKPQDSASEADAVDSNPKDETSETVSMPKLEDGSTQSDSMTDSSNKKPEVKDKSSGTSTTEDSGITRGDQVYSDTGKRKVATKSDTSEQSSTESTKGKRHRRTKKEALRESMRRRQKSNYKSRCSVCKSGPPKKERTPHPRPHNHKHKRSAESGLVSGSGSLSDLGFEYPYLSDPCPAHCRHKRSSITCMESCRDYPCEDFCNSVYRYPPGHGPYEACPCGCVHNTALLAECCRWGDAPRSRYSWNGSEAVVPTGAGACTCRSSHPAYSSRRKVKFAHRPGSKDAQKSDLNEDDEDEPDKGDGSPSASKCDQDSLADVPSKDPLPNGHVLAENGLLEKQHANGAPYAWEEWQQYMRQKTLRSRRKRALCMGVIALSIILFVGVTVSVGLAYLRKKF